jgi:hypothetical protein
MHTKNLYSNHLFRKTVQSDAPAITPDTATEHRINYYYRLQHSKQKIHSNGFGGLMGWIFSTQTFALKSAFIVLTAVLLLVKSPVNQSKAILSIDTCENKTVVVDSNLLVKDTCFN